MDYQNVVIFISAAWVISMITIVFMIHKLRRMMKEIRELKKKIPAKISV
ncbi:MAG TPA: hypothetical protein VK436_14125 [Methanocella sp.]|nr:hypothetical protein [Methanocella sp.]